MTLTQIEHSVYAAPYLERGISFLRRNEFEAAICDFDIVLSFSPDDPYAHWNKATALLSLGDYANGFHEHEWGWRLFSWRGFGPVRNDIDRLLLMPLWDGAPSLRVLLYHELGWGDAIQCFRYLRTLKERCASVTLVIDESLARLARQFGVEVVTKVPQSLHAFDCRLPFFSVMNVLRQTVETIPSRPYIKARWRRTGGKLGLVWSGRTQALFSPQTFIAMLGGCARFSLYALQPNHAPDGVEPLEVADFADTVAVIEQMDHIVTIDTAVAHLAGAMGHPSTHLVLPFMSDWRWWRAGAWYPTIKTYRQPHAGDWVKPFTEVLASL